MGRNRKSRKQIAAAQLPSGADPTTAAAAAGADASDDTLTKRYIVIHPIMLDGEKQPIRTILDMTDEEAERPLKSRYIAEVKENLLPTGTEGN
jgi:hypothetical protein